MPRKVNYGLDDYDDDYDDFEDYGYNSDEEDHVTAVETRKGPNQPARWTCAICTYDNDEGLTACDICGVLRKPIVNNKDTKREPFKFDVPSRVTVPKKKTGDLNGLNSSKKEAISLQSTSALMPKGCNENLDENRFSCDVADNMRPLGDESECSVASTSKGIHITDDTNALPDKGQPQNVTNNINKLSLTAKAGKSAEAKGKKEIQGVEHKPEDWMLPDKASNALTQLNLAIVGHVDSGKSTLSGRLLHLLGRISQKEMHKYEKEAKLQGKGSFAYAWALDESAEERERGVTMTVAVAYFDSKKHHVVLLDSPGHKDFVPNMISGATQADAAIFVIDASVGAFEAGMDSTKGQTREHARVLRGFGVDQIVVAVNKMDAVGYSKDRYDMIRQQLGTFLHSCRFKDSSMTWVPLSAMENQNLTAAPSDTRLLSWYHGPSLLDAIDALKPPSRDFSSPVLMPICDVIKSSSQGQVSACGKVEAGALQAGSKVVVMPSGYTGTVRSLERDSQPCAIARAGDNVAVTLQGVDANQVMAGGVLCHPDSPVSVARHLELTVLVLEGATPILMGSQLEFHIHHAKEAARVARITSLLDPKTGKVTKKSPRCLTAKQTAVLEVVLLGPVCVELFSERKALGRVFLRAMGRTIAMGKVTRIIDDEEGSAP